MALPLLLVVAFAAETGAHPQGKTRTHPEASGQAGKRLKFGTVSIRRVNKTNPRRCHQRIGAATRDGYRMTCMFMAVPILQAYPPREGPTSLEAGQQKFIDFPSWVANDRYNIRARVAPGDLKNWRNPALRPAMLRAMLRSMLADRLKLRVHRGTEVDRVYLLEVRKTGPKFNPAVPGSHRARSRFRMQLPGGGTDVLIARGPERIVHYYGISMPQLARFWSGTNGRAVIDATGLKGRYDISYELAADPAVPSSPADAGPPGPDPAPSVFSTARRLGLKLVPARRAVQTLVLDHIERPSPN